MEPKYKVGDVVEWKWLFGDNSKPNIGIITGIEDKSYSVKEITDECGKFRPLFEWFHDNSKKIELHELISYRLQEKITQEELNNSGIILR